VIRPEVLGTGQDFVGSVLRNESGLAWWLLLSLAVLKAIATATTLGGRGAGGIFMPSLFIGATTGSATALVLDQAWQWSEVQPGAFALVGMAATFSAVARAPLTSILIVFEITGDYGLVLPLMIATAISTILAARVHRESAYSGPLSRMGIHPVHAGVTDLLDTVSVSQVMTPETYTVEADDTLGEVAGVLARIHRRGVPVTEDGQLVGIIAESDILRAGGPSDQTLARDAMTPNPATVQPDTRVSEALERMAAFGVGRLPVVSPAEPTRVIGVFRRVNVINAYHRALGATAQANTLPDRVNIRTKPEAAFAELVIPSGSVADGRKVSEVPWPETCLLVTIHRGSRQLVPTGQTVLHAGDAITVIGGSDATSRLRERITKSTEAATSPAGEPDPDPGVA
jgi:CIC family chloride channel protein